jgi:hypothetical protein
VRPPRLPLGDAYAGVCRANPAEPRQPSESCQAEFCNRGYARGVCECFPSNATCDAVRFSITGDEAGVIRLVYVLERDHAPVGLGVLEYGRASDDLRSPPSSGDERRELLAGQARAFLRSYLRRAEASEHPEP